MPTQKQPAKATKYTAVLHLAGQIERKATAAGIDPCVCARITTDGGVVSVLDRATRKVVRRYTAIWDAATNRITELDMTFTAGT